MVKVGDLMKVTRDEIQDFPGDTIEIILNLQREGWRAQRSNRNHVMLLAPDGVSRYSASRNASSAKYLKEDIERYKRGDKPLTEEAIAKMEEEAEVPAHEKFPCPHNDCVKSYVSQEKLNVHIAVDHEGWLKCPDCDEVRQTPQALGRHRGVAHGYVSPHKPKRKRQEVDRAKKKEEIEILDDVIQTVDNSKFDPTILDRSLQDMIKGGPIPNYIVDADGKVHDAMELRTLSARDREFKQLAANMDPEELGFSIHNNAPKALDAAEIYRQTKHQLEAAQSPEVVRTEDDIEFIDSRDSWVVDDPELMSHSVNTMKSILRSVGLDMEIRVWRKK